MPHETEIILASIKRAHRKMMREMRVRQKLHLVLLSYLREQLGWSWDVAEKDAKAIRERATAMVDCAIAIRAGKPPKKIDPEFDEFAAHIDAVLAAREPFENVEKAQIKIMEAAIQKLPIWTAWAKDVRGLGAKSLAVLIGETGDLSGYPSHSHVWKRCGLAVIDGNRQGGLSKGASKDDWIEHGYNRQRRSMIWVIGDTMIKAQVRKVKDSEGKDTGERESIGPYGEAYLARKKYELERDPEMQPIKAHRRAQRYMEKRLLKHLWQAWRRAGPAEPTRANSRLPAANEHRDAA
jgi:hypothetical protein